MPTAVRALRGATTVDADTAEQVHERTSALVKEMLARNGVHPDDVISILFTSTGDIRSAFPATAARAMGLVDVPLLDARQPEVDGALPRCVRVMMHLSTDLPRHALRHVYLEGARGLRHDLADD